MNLNHLTTFAAMLTMALTSAAAFSQSTEDTIREKLTAAGNAPLAVQPSPMAGLWFVVLPQGPIYVDSTASFVIQGQLFGLSSREPLTPKQLEATTPKVEWKDLPLQDAIKVVKGTGKRKLAVFSDPDCPYCRMLEEKSLAQIKDVTIYTFLYPLPQLHPDAERKSRLIWCSPNRAKAWTDWMTKGTLPAGQGDCTNPLAKNAALGNKLWVFGTPGIVFESGERSPGALPPVEIEKKL